MTVKNIFSPAWLKNYRRAFFLSDLTAGALVAVMLIPQSMAYAMLAGLPPVYGLYASTFPLLVYAFVGSSRHLAVGPVAILSLLAAAACSRLAPPGSADYIQLMLLLTLLVGVLQVLLGILRMGFLLNFISRAVVSGFISAAAIIIGLSQVRHLLGFASAAGGHSALEMAGEIFSGLGETNLPTALTGGGAILAMGLLQKKWPRFPSGLFVVFFAVILVYLFRLDQAGVSIVGEVAGGFPTFSMPILGLPENLARLLPAALIILFVGSMESIAVGQWVASREKYPLQPNREFAGLGLANIAASLFSGYLVTGGFSRTAVNYQTGAKTQLSSIISALLIFAVLLFFTSMFYFLPKAVLAAIIITAVARLIEVKPAIELFRMKKADGYILLSTFLITLSVGIIQGLAAGIVLSLILFIARSAHPRIAVLGYLEKENVYRDIQRFPEAETHPEMIIVRVDASLYFANARFVADWVRNRLPHQSEVKWLIFDMSGVNDIDGDAVNTLRELSEDYGAQNIRLIFVNLKEQVRTVLNRADWGDWQPPVTEYPNLQAIAGLR